ncbi:MAG TPA: hypothetical protein VIX12_03280, partial [Candidatus Binataceae bacterium]
IPGASVGRLLASSSGDRRNNSGGGDLADAVELKLGNIDIAVAIRGDAQIWSKPGICSVAGSRKPRDNP